MQATECYQKNMVNDSYQSLEDQNAGGNADSKDQDQEVSVGNEDFTSSWTPGHLCYTLAKICLYFYPHPETLQETEIKGSILIWQWKF